MHRIGDVEIFENRIVYKRHEVTIFLNFLLAVDFVRASKNLQESISL